ncbi:tetratricopeptide repeat protein [Microbacterium azadirachtae]|uniref:tetratricopeptide repeat protein n=1 Tax=Microbacterium azadirachtae TaxID=582680 RepID=UPI00088EC1FA|nr:tetratricopeptide repeat protein [Microbacterium azadirachtae]UXW86296.1 tetratricopeptide repeat protein [Microbacterium azadirachtae]SDL57314.1 Tetratrico peptide repeat-containing protein [Microbacterium azadirachtae]SEF86053.1 Tetratrico peptide repeat-containing protein [Microbacterium azadirachtae]SEF87915.1 Tetratrico peptide repeat-containing protein [Microbacterium azadirachtae]
MSTDPELHARLDEIFAARDRARMAPTIAAFLDVLAEHPDDPAVLYEVGGAYDTDGQEETALGYYRRAMAAGLEGRRLRQCFLQLGSTLRNLGRLDESLAAFDEGIALFPESESLGLFRALTLHAMGRPSAALGAVLTVIADRFPTAEVRRYEAALRGNAAYLASLDD